MLFSYFLKTICVVVVLIIIGVFCVEKDDYQSSSHFINNNRGQIVLDKQSDYVGGIRSSVTIEDLLHNTYSTKISNDLDVDICKAGGFQGDIALPNINYEREYLQLKKEVSEGLQVEEEGLTDYLRIKLKQAAHPEDYLATTKKPKSHYNDPESDLLQHQNYFDQKQQNGGIKKNIDLKKNHHLQNGDLQQNGGLKKYNKLHNHVTTAVPNHINVMPTKINESDLQDEVNRTFEEGSDVEKLKNDSIHGKSSEEIGLEVTSAQSMSTIPTFASSSSSSSVENTSNAGGKREKKRHKRRRRRFRKRKLTSNTYNEMKSEGGDDTSSQTNITVQLSTSSSTLVIASPPSSVNSTNSSNSNSNKTHDHINSLANSQSTSSSSSSLQQTNSSHRITRSLLTKYLYSTTNINNNKESYDDDINDTMKRRRRRSKSSHGHGRRIVHRHEITNSEIPVHEFEERFEGPPKPPHKVLPTSSSSSKHDNNLNFIKGLFPIVGSTNILGDDIAEQRHVRVTRAATARKERIWDYGVIPYEIDTNFSGAHKALFKQAMRHWENSTCVKFVERVPDEHPNYIIFTERPCGCCSFVGKRGNGAQAISIGKNCDKFGIVVHELGHVVGFWHEHTRPDRDNHVQIFREHIMNGQDYNFNKLTEEEVNSLGLPYDYDSIMHYAKNTFSRGSYLDTIAPQENKIRGKPVPEIGQRLRLSQGDIAQTNLLYKCAKCGRTFQENSGTFSSPNYPNLSRGESEKCEWRITATHGERIVLNITELDIFKSNDCGSDYIEIKDGYWHKSPNLGRFCGSGRLVDPIISTGSRMLVTYITSAKSIEHRGFSASYEAVCGGELEVTTGGHLESPNYPEDYLKNKECVWKLIVPPTFTVALRFQSFEIENHDNCVYDYVEVIDGFEPDSPQIGKFCGYKVPPDIKSTSNHLLVKFFSDGSVQKAGFSASFMKEYNECNQTNHGCEHDCINTLGSYECACRIGYELHSDGKHCEAACGGIYDSPNGTITSPSFPALYPENKNCIWEIIAPPQFRITLNFTHFDLEGNNLYQQECDYDSVIVQSKLADDVIKKHGTYCGTVLPDMITSEGNSLRIIFSSDLTVQKSGFAAIFFTDMDECAIDNGGCQHECSNTIGSYKCSCHNGFTLHENGHDCKEGGCKFEVTSPHGEITSPNYPDHYPSRKDCVWHFVTTPGHRIKLNFEKFEMEPHPDCAYDHIVLYDGDSPESRTLGRYCGSKLPHPIIASSNQMFMVFKSDASVQRKGFRAIHSTACGGLLQATGTVKHFYSHSKYGDHNYANRMDCEWTIQPLARRSVILTFLTFELEDEITNCSYDYVSIVAGLDASGYKYGRYCGSKMPSTIISNGEALVVRFRSDDSIVSKGFSASYVAGDQFDITDESEMGLEAADDDDLDSDDEDTIINNNNDNSSLENY